MAPWLLQGSAVSRGSGLERADKDRWIDPGFIQADIPVKVRSRRSPCRTDQADHRAACQGLTCFDINPGEVAEHADKALAVIDEDCVSVVEVISGQDHLAVRRCLDRSAGGHREIQA